MVGQALGHSNSSRGRGLTEKYIGHLRTDNWRARVDATTDDDMALGNFNNPDFVENPFKRQRSSTTEVQSVLMLPEEAEAEILFHSRLVQQANSYMNTCFSIVLLVVRRE